MHGLPGAPRLATFQLTALVSRCPFVDLPQLLIANPTLVRGPSYTWRPSDYVARYS